MSYCSKCGNQLNEGAKFCPNCGNSTVGGQSINNQSTYQQTYQPIYQPYKPVKNIIQQLSSKITTEAIIWLIVACIQYILGIVYIIYNSEVEGMAVMGITVIIVAIVNTIFSIQNFKYSSEVLRKPVGIVDKYMPVANIVASLVYNILFGGLIGVAGTIYAFVIRNFVMSNTAEFINIERKFMSQVQPNQVQRG